MSCLTGAVDFRSFGGVFYGACLPLRLCGVKLESHRTSMKVVPTTIIPIKCECHAVSILRSGPSHYGTGVYTKSDTTIMSPLSASNLIVLVTIRTRSFENSRRRQTLYFSLYVRLCDRLFFDF